MQMRSPLALCILLTLSVAPLAQAAQWGDAHPEDMPAKLDIVPWRDWLVEIGPHHNSYPGGGNDPCNQFGAIQGEIDDFLGSWDIHDPPPLPHQLCLRFTGDQWGDNPTYPAYDPASGSKGLARDVRAPYDWRGREFKIWKAEVLILDSGYTYDLVWNLDPYPGSGLELPPWIGVRLDMDGSFAHEPPGDDPCWSDGANYEVNLRPRHGGPEYAIRDLPQTGETEVWYIIAGYVTLPIGVPEPSGAAAVVPLGAAAVGLAVKRLRGR